MTLRQRQALTCIGIAVVLVGMAATELIKTPSGVEVGDDDDSGNGGGDDDSAPFSKLPPAPKD